MFYSPVYINTYTIATKYKYYISICVRFIPVNDIPNIYPIYQMYIYPHVTMTHMGIYIKFISNIYVYIKYIQYEVVSRLHVIYTFVVIYIK